MSIEHASGPRQGHSSNQKWVCTTYQLLNTGVNHYPGTAMALVTLPELRFPFLTNKYRRPIHPEIEEYMRRYVSNDQDWEQVDDEDCWGINYTEPKAQIREKIETILHTWGGGTTRERTGRGNKTEPTDTKVFGATRVQRSKDPQRYEPGE